MPDHVEILRACPVLSGFTDAGLKMLAAVSRERLYKNAQALQRQGEPPRDAGVIFLATGRVRCEVRDEQDRQLGLGSLGPGDHLGALRLFGDSPSPITATAESEVSALVIDRAAYERLRRQKPQAALKLMLLLSAEFGRRLSENAGLFAEFAIYAAQKTNLAERNPLASFIDVGVDSTPTLRLGGSLVLPTRR